MNGRTRVLRRLRRHRTPVAVLVAAVAVGSALLVYCVTELPDAEVSAAWAVQGPAYAAVVLATAGSWAETRGAITAGSWWRRPRVALAEVRVALADRPVRNLYGKQVYEVDATDMIDCREPAVMECEAGAACAAHRVELEAAASAEGDRVMVCRALPGRVCGEHLRPDAREVPDVAPAA